jgi:hypothetical protein
MFTPSEQQEFLGPFQHLVVPTYSKRLLEYADGGGGRGARIGAASGALVGTVGASNAQNAAGSRNSSSTPTMGSAWHPEDRQSRNMPLRHHYTLPIGYAPQPSYPLQPPLC